MLLCHLHLHVHFQPFSIRNSNINFYCSQTKNAFLELVSDAQHDTGMSISAQQKLKGKVTY